MIGAVDRRRRWSSWASLRRWLAIAAGVLFWGWLVARWLNDWVLPAGIAVPPGDPFVSPEAVGQVWGSLGFAVRYLPELASGIWLTLILTAVSLGLGFVIAVPLSIVRVYGNRSAYVALAYIELIRGTPLIAQLFVLYYGTGLTSVIRELPMVGSGFVPAQAFWVAIIGFTINSAAYQAEYLRSALGSVGEGQMEAAQAVGLSKLGAIRNVILPQALRYVIPAWSNEMVYLVKYSSLASFITVTELFGTAEFIASQNFEYTGIFTLVALLYIGVVLTMTGLVSRLERVVTVPGIDVSGRR